MSSRNGRRTNDRSVRSRRRRLLAEPLEDRRLLAVSFEFNYVGGNAIGFNDPSEGDRFKTALETAASRVGGWLMHDATIQMDVESHAFNGTALAKANSEASPSLSGGGFVHGVIPSKIVGQTDSNGGSADGHLEVFFFDTSDIFTYATDPSESNVDDHIDFQAVIIHELIHTLGFTSATNASGRDDSGNGITTPGTWSMFDQFLSDVDGNRLIDGDPQSPTAYRMDVSSTGWPSVSVGGKGPDGGLFFDGPIATAVHGGRVPLYSPAPFQSESSVSHLDSEGFPNSSFVFSPLTHLMSHATVDGVVPQELTLIEKAILADIGIMLREDVAPSVTAPAEITLEGNSQGGFSGLNQELQDFLDAAIATDLLDPNPTLSNDKPDFLPLGQNTITFTATDASGNIGTTTSVISVVDTIAPMIGVNPPEVTIEATGPRGAAGVTLPFEATVSDVVDPNPIVTFNPGSEFPLGTTTATYTAQDSENNISTFDVQIIVVDTTAPEFTLPAEITIDSNLLAAADLTHPELIELIAGRSSDLVDQSLSISAQPETFPVGTTSVTFTVTDDNGNSSAATTLLTVRDTDFVVTTLDDELDADPESDLTDLSLREAILLANNSDGPDSIRFDLGLSGTVQIDEALGRLEISDSLTLFGLGRDQTTIDGQGASGVIAITAAAGDVTITGFTISGGSLDGDFDGGAGIHSASPGTLTINDTAIANNTTSGEGSGGAGIRVTAGNLVLHDTIVSGNQVQGVAASGGGIWAAADNVIIHRSSFIGNLASGSASEGGGLYLLNGAATITASSFSDNATESSQSGGGAIALRSAEATIINSTIAGNSTAAIESPGGGIYSSLSPVKLVSSTVSGNTSTLSHGGGIYADRGDLDIQNSTLTANHSGGDGGGIGLPATDPNLSLTIHNSIVAGNTDSGTAPDFVGSGVLVEASAVKFSLIGDNTGTTLLESPTPDPATGNIVGDPNAGGVIDPMLGPLADNGGSTETHLLLASSPAIDAGDPSFDAAVFSPPVIQDQRGFPRIVGLQLDIGSVEVLGEIVIDWDYPADIVFGTQLGDVQLNATTDIAGTFTYSPSAGTILSVGEAQRLTTIFTPDDLVNFSPTMATAFITVVKADPVIAWNPPEPIVFGTALDSTHLNATADVPGTFQYMPSAGELLEVGNDQVLSVTFTPTDSASFNTVTSSVLIDVISATPVLTWNDPDDLDTVTPLGAEQLNATANVPGSFAYVPPAGVLLSAGLNRTLSVTFTPDSPNFESVTTTVTIDVHKADPVISWDDPSDIVAGTALGETQLNATSSVAGTFEFDPIAGTVLEVGEGQVLSTTFTPEDTAKFNVVTATATINVIAAQDYGDAPANYPVLLADDGARHTMTSLTLGGQVDVDVDGAPSDMADGDGSDDDGVLAIADLVAVADADTRSSFTVTASGAGRLDAWIDFNRDGDWDDNGEQIFTNVDVFAGDNTLGYAIPAGTSVGGTAARFRLSTAGNLTPTGSAADGEVEDYLVSILDGGSAPVVEVGIPDDGIELSVESNHLVVRSGQTALFRAPVANVGSLSVVGTERDETLSIDVGNGFSAPAEGIQLAGGAGGNTLAIRGDQGELDFTDALISATEFRHLDLSSSDASTITIDAAAVDRLSPALKVVSIHAEQGDKIIVSDAKDWRLGDPSTSGGVFVLTANYIAGGNQRLEANVPRPWQNFLQAGDVNNDGSVTAGDALRIINELDRRRYSDGDTQILHAPLSVGTWPDAYFDQNGDDRATALDALRVINEMAAIEASQESGEGEAALVSTKQPRRLPSSRPQLSQPSKIQAEASEAGPWFATAASEHRTHAAAAADASKVHDPVETARAVDELLSSESFIDLLSP